MENFTLNTMVEKAKAAGYKRIVGEYLPTAKNGMVVKHYPQLGFTNIEGSNTAKWMLDLNGYKEKECYIIRADGGN